MKAPESVPSTTLPIRRKERSLSQLVVNTPKVSSQTTMTGKRTKATARKASALQGSNFSIEKAVKKEEDSAGDRPESSSSPETLSKFAQNIRQVMKSIFLFFFILVVLIVEGQNMDIVPLGDDGAHFLN